MAKKPYHHGDLKKALVEGALEILDAGETLSLRTVSQRVGVSHNAAYRHFDGLDDLLGEVAAASLRELAVAIAESMSAHRTLRENNRRGMYAYLDYAMGHPGRYALVFSQKVPIFAHAAAHAAAEDAFELVRQRAELSGSPRPAHTAFLIWTMIHGTVELLVRDVLPADLDSVRAELLEQTVEQAVLILDRFEGDGAG